MIIQRTITLGDQSLFNGGPADAELTVGGVFYKNVGGKPLMEWLNADAMWVANVVTDLFGRDLDTQTIAIRSVPSTETNALSDDDFCDIFADWWDRHGSLVRTGGGQYERSFAFEAFRYLMPMVMAGKFTPPVWTNDDRECGYLPSIGASFMTSVGERECIRWNKDKTMALGASDDDVYWFPIPAMFPLQSVVTSSPRVIGSVRKHQVSPIERDGIPSLYVGSGGVNSHRISERDIPVWCNSLDDSLRVMNILNQKLIPDTQPKRWTTKDQKAGRLPEVGAKCRQGHKDEIVVAVTEKFVVTECQDMSVCTTRKDVFMRSYNPIETPEEKAVRLCNEWCKTAADIFVRHPSSSATESMGGIYKAMLSGDLPAPGKE